MNLNIESIVRSVAVAAVCLPVSLSIAGAVGTIGKVAVESTLDTPRETIIEDLKTELTRDCLLYATSKVDSKMERKAKTAIEEAVGDGADFKSLCEWVL